MYEIWHLSNHYNMHEMNITRYFLGILLKKNDSMEFGNTLQ